MLNCSISEIQITNTDQTGWIFKFESAIRQANSTGTGRKHKPCTFQFRFDRMRGSVIGEFTDNLVDD